MSCPEHTAPMRGCRHCAPPGEPVVEPYTPEQAYRIALGSDDPGARRREITAVIAGNIAASILPSVLNVSKEPIEQAIVKVAQSAVVVARAIVAEVDQQDAGVFVVARTAADHVEVSP